MFALVYNGKIEVGPRDWSWPPFKSFLDDNILDTSALPRTVPNGPIVTDTWKILPVEAPSMPTIVAPYEQPAGPYWTIHEDHITGEYQVAPINMEVVKSQLKATVTANRYEVEVQGILLTIQGQQVTIDTARGSRDIFFQTYLALGEAETVNWKFPETWLELTKLDLGLIVQSGKAHIQSTFDWEKDKLLEIDAATTREELEALTLRHPSQPEPRLRQLRRPE